MRCVMSDTPGLTFLRIARYNLGMGRSSAKKGARALKNKRPGSQRKKATRRKATEPNAESCIHCERVLAANDRALFVEEEVGRIFCSETCIADYFAPEIEKLEKEYFRLTAPEDLNAKEREDLAHLRWVTLQEPDEVWRQKTLKGDVRYTLIAEFEPGNKRIWCVCICLLLRGEPSFLFLAFPTRNEAMVDHYRRGERVEWQTKPAGESETSEGAASEDEASAIDAEPKMVPSDGLADDWTADETLRAQLLQGRSQSDIPILEYPEYQSCMEETLEHPDEVWGYDLPRAAGEKESRFYHFIRRYSESGKKPYWYIIVARELDEEEQIEILDAFPSNDGEFVAQFKQGKLEYGKDRPDAAHEVSADDNTGGTRVIH